MNLPTGRSPTSSGYAVASSPDRLDIADYIEQSRSILEIQRINFERERATFAEERKLWERERRFLKERIVNTERQLDRILKGGMATAASAASQKDEGHLRVWEGSHPTSNPTRIFMDGITEAPIHPSNNDPLGAGRSLSLDDALSPRSYSVDRAYPVGIPIEMVDSSLDGITLKSTGLPPDIAAKLSSPSPDMLSSPHFQTTTKPIVTKKVLPYEPPIRDERTPTIRNENPAVNSYPRGINDTPPRKLSATVKEQLPDHGQQPPQQPLPQDMETSSQIFDLDEDPALEGPLGLQNDEIPDKGFLEELDQKLLREAQRALSRPSYSDSESLSNTIENEPETEPEIRFKNTTNFGTAFGSIQRRKYI